MNRLATATSPYLLQHKDNPVHWWQWGEDAFDEARRRDVPVLLSVGYAACHWCHVMAHESFEDDATAAVMNENFVSIKVDREERPDVDAVYMAATQAMTGHGGWPMTCFLTPDGEPFFCGTYYPPTPHGGMPSFRQVLASVAQAWRERRDEITKAGGEIVRLLGERAAMPPGEAPPSPDDLEAAITALRRDFDDANGGFGGAPKFPPSTSLEFLLRHGSLGALDMVGRTCEAMARGGIYDQLAGGFARYSVDASWIVPHFEKMLYDNALLLRVYLHWWRSGGGDLARRIAEETAGFLLSDLRTPEGGFASALDADTDGVEGATYVWTPAELREVLGDADGAWAAEVFGVTPAGTFEHGASTLRYLADVGADDVERLASVRSRLRDARQARPQPARDDKAVTAWNGLAIAALAEAGVLLQRPNYLDAARVCARLMLDVHLVGGRLRRASRDGVAGEPAGVLEDYANLAEGLLTLAQVDGDGALLGVAGSLLDVVLERFSDGQGGFFDTADDAERLVRRPQDPTDNATPAGQSAAAGALLTYAALTGSARHRQAAEAALGVTARIGPLYPTAAGWGLAVAAALVAGPQEIAIVGESPDLVRTAWTTPTAGAVIATAANPEGTPWAPLLEARGLVDGAPAAFVCRQFTCQQPVTQAAELRALLLA